MTKSDCSDKYQGASSSPGETRFWNVGMDLASFVGGGGVVLSAETISTGTLLKGVRTKILLPGLGSRPPVREYWELLWFPGSLG